MRIPLAVSIESRDGTVDKDAKVVNGLVEMKGEESFVRKRPGTADLGEVESGTAQLLTVWNGIKVVTGDVLSAGTIGTIISGPTQTTLTTANDNLPMDAQATNNDAATPRLFFKSREKAWVVNRAGSVSTVSYASNMGAATYNLISLTRSGTTATATMAEDVFNVGDTVTIAGAGQADYNGAQTVTAITEGSTIPQEEIPITITRSGTTATATTVSGLPHGLTSGSSYTIEGANQSAYNGSKAVTTSAGATTFTYTVTVTTATTVTWNPSDKDADVTLSGANLTAAVSSSTAGAVRANVSKASGKWYWEVTVGAVGSFCTIGAGNSSAGLSAAVGVDTNSWGLQSNGYAIHNNAFTFMGTFTVGDVVGVALDLDSGTIGFYKNGAFLGQLTGVSGTLFPMVGLHLGSQLTAKFAPSFTHSIPSDYYAFESDDPVTPATGSIIVTRPGVTTNPTFTYTVANNPATPATGTITAASNGGTVPGTPYINGYFCVMDVNGVIWHSNSDDPTTWGSLAFVTAQVENGAGKALAKSQNYLVAFKEWSTELFFDRQDGGGGSAFSPVDSGFTRIGCANGHSVADVDGKLLWIAQTKEEQSRSVYMGVGIDQVKVSTHDVDRIVSADDLATVHAYGLSLDGHHLYVLTLVSSGITLVYDLTSKAWTQWTTLTLGSAVNISSITRSGDIATVTTATAHGLNDGDPVRVIGSDQNEYNGRFQAMRISSTVFKYRVLGNPTTPATGTMTIKPYTESYFKFTKAASYQGTTLLLHESDGRLVQFDSARFLDAVAGFPVPINVHIRTTRLDGGTTARKKMPVIRVIADETEDVAMLRYSDDDGDSFSAYRLVDLSTDEPEIRRCGAFKHRTLEFRQTGNALLQLSALEIE